MGGLFGGKSKKTTEKKEETQKDLLGSNKEFVSLFNRAVTEGNNMSVPQYEYAGLSDQTNQAISRLLEGVDLSDYKTAQDYMQNLGQSQLTSGLNLQSQAQNQLTSLANMSNEDYSNLIKGQFNNSLVQEQLAAATADINDERNQAIYDLNQSASLSGNMGSSRSGIAQGVIEGKALRAVGSASVQYRTAESAAATQRVQNLLGLRQSSASTLANLAQSQISTGYGAYNQGMGYLSQYQAGYLQNQQNAVNAGLLQQQQRQNMLDYSRQNQILLQSPALARLGIMSPILSPLARSSTFGTSTTTTTAPAANGMMGGIMGAAGAAAGAYFGGPLGAKLGAGLGTQIGQSM
ncbi:hypothetical protein VAA96_004543 [Salmonella enterica]|nr:hypothetical protein [Salmonella enterica]